MTNPPLSLSELFVLHSRVTRLLEQHGIQHCLAGGLAVSVWGEPRTTFDVDLVVATTSGQVEELLAALAGDPLFSLAPNQFALTPCVTIVRAPVAVTPAETRQSEIVVVDFLIVPPRFCESILQRAVAIDVAGCRRRVCTPEDLILLKLLSARVKDREDIRLILAVQTGHLDFKYLAQWATILEVGSEWAEFQKD